MKVKMFRGDGADGIREIEQNVNDWLLRSQNITIKDTQTSMCTVGDNRDGELFQYVVVTVWYNEMDSSGEPSSAARAEAEISQ